jgi:hypothetical protein
VLLSHLKKLFRLRSLKLYPRKVNLRMLSYCNGGKNTAETMSTQTMSTQTMSTQTMSTQTMTNNTMRMIEMSRAETTKIEKSTVHQME